MMYPIAKNKYWFRPVVLLFLLFLTGNSSTAQTTRRVLFLGNSYTAVNNLPQMIKDVALSAGDSLFFDSYAPGGYTLGDHKHDPVSLNKIRTGNWDYVVLQGQSQEPVIQNSAFYNGGYALDDSITLYNPCGTTMFYITWGRKNGDASNCAGFPLTCTYAGMDSTLRNAYINLAANVKGELSPVSVVWNYLRQHSPGIELYQADESHPSQAGTFAAACCFYAAIFKKDPTLITYNVGINTTDAAIIKNAAKVNVFDHLGTWDYGQLPQSGFTYSVGPGVNEVIFTPVNGGVPQTYSWDFGDGFTSSAINPVHAYALNGIYTVTLTTANCDIQGWHTSTANTVIQFCNHTPGISSSHAWLCNYDTLWTQPADAYQWYSGGIPIPETNQYLPGYQQYSSLNFSVLTTVGGCSEMSQTYTASPEWSGYYFDAAWGGDPCQGDTAIFIVLHINGMSGTEIINWYKNDTLLPWAGNQDTLLITTEGNYHCKVINPASECPWDTTISSIVSFDCNTLTTGEIVQAVTWRIYPNPVSETITIELTDNNDPVEVRVYDSYGHLVKTAEIAGTTLLSMKDLPAGLYYIRLQDHRKTALKFIKQ